MKQVLVPFARRIPAVVGIVASAACLCLMSARVHAQAQADTTYINELRPERLITPAEPFAKDYAQGPIRALFITPLRFGASREIVELQQRFDLEFDAVTVIPWRGGELGSSSMFMPKKNTSTADKNRALQRKLDADWDVIVLANSVKLNGMTPKSRYLLLKKVSEGTGLVTLPQRMRSVTRKGLPKAILQHPVEEVDANSLLAGVPFPLIHSYKQESSRGNPDKMLNVYRFGKGRVAIMQVSGSINQGYSTRHALTPIFPYDFREHTYYKYYLSAFAKAMLAAVPAKAPRITAAADNPRMVEVEFGKLPATVSAGGLNVPKGSKGTLKAELRGFFRDTTALPDQDFEPGEHKLAFNVPKLPRGDYFIDYRFVSRRGTETWGSLGVTVGNAPAALVGVSPDKTVYRPHETARINAKVEAQNLDGLSLQLSVFDLDNREIARRRLAVDAAELHTELSLADTRMIPHHAIVRLQKDGRTLDVAHTRFAVIQPLPPFYSHTACPRQPSLIGYYAGLQLRKAGFSGLFAAGAGSGGMNPMWTDIHGAVWGPNNLRIKPPTKETPQATYADPEYLQENALEGVLSIARERGETIDTWTLGDEQGVTYTRPRVADAEREAFQDFLKQTYNGDIAKLNEEFGTDFKAFDQVPVPDVNQLGRGQVVYKHLWMHFVEKLFTDTLHKVGQAIQHADPDPEDEPYGLSGTTMPDLDMLHGFKLWHGYPNRIQNVAMRSFMSADSIRGNWWGGYMHSRRLGARPLWDLLLKGGVNASYYWSHSAEGMLSADLSYADFFEETQYAAMREIHDKLGPLLRETPVARTGFAVYYSRANEHIHSEDLRFGTPGASRDALVSFSEKLGIPAWFVSKRTVADNALVDDNVKILFLTQAEAMPDATAQRLREWVRDGGVLVADIRTGLRNGRGAPRDAGILDTLFGIGQDPEGTPVELGFDLPGTATLPLENMVVDGSVKLADGVPAATVGNGVPVVIERDHGKGKAVFLNIALGRLLNNYADEPAVHDFVKIMLTEAGVWTGLEAPEGYFTTRFGGPGYELLSCRIRGRGRPDGTLKLGRSRHVYDVRSGNYRGETDSLVPSDDAGKENLYALTARPIGPFEVSFPDRVAAGEKADLVVQPENGDEYAPNLRRLFRVRVLRPSGEDPDYRRQLTANPAYIPALQTFAWSNNAPVRIELPFAHNREPGIYTLEVLDILSGTVKTKTFDLQP